VPKLFKKDLAIDQRCVNIYTVNICTFRTTLVFCTLDQLKQRLECWQLTKAEYFFAK